jgi:hypothetical protein
LLETLLASAHEGLSGRRCLQIFHGGAPREARGRRSPRRRHRIFLARSLPTAVPDMVGAPGHQRGDARDDPRSRGFLAAVQGNLASCCGVSATASRAAAGPPQDRRR